MEMILIIAFGFSAGFIIGRLSRRIEIVDLEKQVQHHQNQEVYWFHEAQK